MTMLARLLFEVAKTVALTAADTPVPRKTEALMPPSTTPLTTNGDFFMQNARLCRWLAIVGLSVLSLVLTWMLLLILSHVINLVILTICSVLFAYAVYPPIKLLVKRGVNVGLASTLVYGLLFFIVIGALAWLTPAIISQSTDLAKNYPSLIAKAQDTIAHPSTLPLLSKLPAGIRSKIAENAAQAGHALGGIATTVGAKSLVLLTGATAAIANFAVILGFASLFITDLAMIQKFFLRLIPVKSRAEAGSIMREIDQVVGGFVRGQLLMAGGIALIASITLIILGIPYAALFAVFAALINIIPIVGAFIALVPVAFVAFFAVGWLKAVIAVVLLFVIFQIQQQIFTPLLVSKTVGITPLVLFFALIAGGEVAGIFGALLAIPVAGIIRVVIDRIFPDNISEHSAAVALDGPTKH